MAERGIYVEVRVAAPLDMVWELTQDPEQHVRWDVRFSEILPTNRRAFVVRLSRVVRGSSSARVRPASPKALSSTRSLRATS